MNKRIMIISLTVVAAFALMGLMFVNVQAASPTVAQANQIFQFTQTIEGGEVSNLDEFTVTLMVAPPYNLAAIQPFTITNPLQWTGLYEVVDQSANITYADNVITWKSTVGPTSPAQSAWFVLKIKESYLIQVPNTYTNTAFVQLDAVFAGTLPIGSLPGGSLPGGSLPDGTVGQTEVQFTVIPGDEKVVELTPGVTTTLTYTSTEFSIDIEIPGDAITQPTTLRYLPLPSTDHPVMGWDILNLFGLDAFHGPKMLTGFKFLKPINITIKYTDDWVAGKKEERLSLFYWKITDMVWGDVANTCTPASEYMRDMDNNTLSVGVCHLTNFATVIKSPVVLYMPLISR